MANENTTNDVDLILHPSEYSNIPLLQFLNGERNGLFYSYIESLKKEPRIAWYPSAGIDFQPLLFLTSEFEKSYPSEEPDAEIPDLFLYTDYWPFPDTSFLSKPILFSDSRTKIIAEVVEDIQILNLPFSQKIITFKPNPYLIGRVFFMKIRIESDKFGTYWRPLIYVIAENESFCANILLKYNAKISHVIHVNYGASFGGGYAAGAWLLNVLERFKTEVYINDRERQIQVGDLNAVNTYPSLRGYPVELKTIRTLKSGLWKSNNNSIKWYSVEQCTKNSKNDDSEDLSKAPNYIDRIDFEKYSLGHRPYSYRPIQQIETTRFEGNVRKQHLILRANRKEINAIPGVTLYKRLPRASLIKAYHLASHNQYPDLNWTSIVSWYKERGYVITHEVFDPVSRKFVFKDYSSETWFLPEAIKRDKDLFFSTAHYEIDYTKGAKTFPHTP